MDFSSVKKYISLSCVCIVPYLCDAWCLQLTDNGSDRLDLVEFGWVDSTTKYATTMQSFFFSSPHKNQFVERQQFGREEILFQKAGVKMEDTKVST